MYSNLEKKFPSIYSMEELLEKTYSKWSLVPGFSKIFLVNLIYVCHQAMSQKIF